MGNFEGRRNNTTNIYCIQSTLSIPSNLICSTECHPRSLYRRLSLITNKHSLKAIADHYGVVHVVSYRSVNSNTDPRTAGYSRSSNGDFKLVNINNNTACSKCVNLFVDNSVLTVRQNGHTWSLEPSMVTSWHSC